MIGTRCKAFARKELTITFMTDFADDDAVKTASEENPSKWREMIGRVARSPQMWGNIMLISAAVMIFGAGLLLAAGHPRAHTLAAYTAVALAGVGVLLALPQAMRGGGLDEERVEDEEEESSAEASTYENAQPDSGSRGEQ